VLIQNLLERNQWLVTGAWPFTPVAYSVRVKPAEPEQAASRSGLTTDVRPFSASGSRVPVGVRLVTSGLEIYNFSAPADSSRRTCQTRCATVKAVSAAIT
jgi:hypothetical protein